MTDTWDRCVKYPPHWIRTEYMNIHLNEINRKFHFTICYLYQISLLFNYEFNDEFDTHPHMHASIHSRMCAPPCECYIFTVLELNVSFMKETSGKKRSELRYPPCCHLFLFAIEFILAMTMMQSDSHSIYSFIFSFIISLILKFSTFESPIIKYKLLLFKNFESKWLFQCVAIWSITTQRQQNLLAVLEFLSEIISSPVCLSIIQRIHRNEKNLTFYELYTLVSMHWKMHQLGKLRTSLLPSQWLSNTTKKSQTISRKQHWSQIQPIQK